MHKNKLKELKNEIAPHTHTPETQSNTLCTKYVYDSGIIVLVCIYQSSVPQLVYQMPWYVLSRSWDGACIRSLAAKLKRVSCAMAVGFVSLSVRSQLTLTKVLIESVNKIFPFFFLSFLNFISYF